MHTRFEMAEPIYVNSFWRCTPAWYQTSEREREDLEAKLWGLFGEIGCRVIIACSSRWSSEQWLNFAVTKFPSIEAVQGFYGAVEQTNSYQYCEATSVLGTKWPDEWLEGPD